MNSHLLRLSVVTAVGLLVVQTAKATIYTFDVDSSSGIGSGSFSIDLPDSWPANIGHSTLIPASSVKGSYARGDKWKTISVALNEFIELPDNAELSGTSKKAGSFKVPTSSFGLSPVEAVANLPGVTLRAAAGASSEVGHHKKKPSHEPHGPQKKPKPVLSSGLWPERVPGGRGVERPGKRGYFLRGDRWSFHQLILDGVVSQLGVAGHGHFFQDARSVGAHGFDAQGKFSGDPADGLAGRDHAQDDELPIG